uniref:hypothetical chloroplast RF1 n=1 Tax=Patrinia monandra TaxID=1530334 RepID=UPI001EF9F021|nr:hypothetical chloroplast RF1 [Patrinia monandra]YP_010280500.1 hypothetical chloroplast RF1 [Patrinia monandra]UKG23320.1 hypothetical chloroplast RF1 [Patrinia monandra]UKG23332.1 hypothetical chloroplast RF1 [Patrinia monandra]
MILKYFRLPTLVALGMKIINSAVVVGLYYGFLTTLSIGPSYLFLLRAHVVEEGTEKKVSATTGFLMGQLMMFISIYYAPLHLALGRPHTITVLALPYLLFHFFRWNNDNDKEDKKNFFAYQSTTRNSMRNLSTQCLFLNHLIFQLFNHFLLPSSMLVRLVNIDMFRCNNKMLFVTSSFVGWLIGHILFMKRVGLVLVWIRPARLIRWNQYVRSKKYLPAQFKSLMSEFTYLMLDLINYPARIYSILLFIICAFYLGRTPTLLLTKKPKAAFELKRKTEVGEESEEEGDVELEGAYERAVAKQEKAGFTSLAELRYFFLEQKEKKEEKRLQAVKNQDLFCFWFDFVEKLPVLFLFNYQEWNRPLRYIKNNRLEGGVKNEMSQYFFHTCRSDGKKRISFTYPPSLSTFCEMIQRRIGMYFWEQGQVEIYRNLDVFTPKKPSYAELCNPWVDTKNQKRTAVKKEFLNRIKALDKGFLFEDMLEKKTRLYKEQEKVQKGHNPFSTYEPFFNEKTQKNKNHVPQNYDPLLDGPYRPIVAVRSLWIVVDKGKDSSLSELKGLGNNRIRNYFLHCLMPRSFFPHRKQNFKKADLKKNKTKAIECGKKKIQENIPRWTSKLISDLEFTLQDFQGFAWEIEDPDIHSRTLKQILLFSQLSELLDPRLPNEVLVPHYIDEPDFRRNIIKGTGRALRRKTVSKLILPRPYSPLFWGKTQSKLEAMLYKLFFRIWKRRDSKVFDDTQRKKKIIDPKAKNEKRQKTREERLRLETEEAWENLPHGPQIRTSLLVMQSILRKYILFPLFIIAKNTVHFLAYRVSDWDEDFAEWAKEIHIPCTHSGVPLRENELLGDFLGDGFDIKIISPFSLKPWCRSKLQDSRRNLIKNKNQSQKLELGFCYLTVWGMEAEEPFGSPRTRSSSSSPFIAFFKLILKNLPRQMKKKTKKVLALFKIGVTELSQGNSIPLDKLKNLSKSSKTKDESFTQIGSIDFENYSQTDLQMKNLTDRTSRMRNEIQRLEKDKRKVISEIKSSLDSNVELESQPPKNSRKFLIRRNVRLIIKLHYFIKIFIEKKYIDIFLPIINIAAINTKHFVESIIEKYISNNERNQSNNEKNQSKNETTEKDINFISISTIKKSGPTKKNSHIFYDLSSLSQGYVFYKLSQLEVINLSKIRSVLQYQGTSIFLKTTIKDSFGIQGIFHSQLRDKKLRSYDQWKNWLRGHFQYNSPIEWSRLIPQKWRTRVNQRWTDENKDFKKWSSYEKDLLVSFDYTNPTSYQVYSQKEKLHKCYRFGLLLDQFINFETKKDSSIYGSPLEVSEKKNLFYTIDKLVSEDMNIDLKNNEAFLISRHLLNLIDTGKRLDRKYLDWKSHFLRQNNNDNKDLFYLRFRKDLQELEIIPPNSHEIFVDWLKIDKVPRNSPQKEKGDWGFWFFPEFVRLFKEYKVNPWTLPSRLLLLTIHLTNYLYKRRRRKPLFDEKERKANLDFFMKVFLAFQVHWYNKVVAQRTLDMFVPFSYLMEEGKALKRVTNSVIISLVTERLSPNQIMVSSTPWIAEKIKLGIMVIEPIRRFSWMNQSLILHEALSISLAHKSEQLLKQGYRNGRSYFYVDESTASHQIITGNREKNHYDLLVPENILSSRRRRELRILTSFKFKNRKCVDRNSVFRKETKIRNSGPFLKERKHRDRDQNEFIKLKFFLWPNFRLEDLACMNRYWFDTNNGSRFSMLRIYMYPRLKIS